MNETQKESEQVVNPEEDDWEFARIFTEINDNHREKLTTSTWDLSEFMKAVKNKGRRAANAFRKIKNEQTREKIDGASQSSLKAMYKYIKGGMTAIGSSIWDQDTEQHVFDMEGQHEIMIREWKKVFDKHKENPPEWRDLEEAYGKYEPGTPGAPDGTPSAEMLYRRAQKGKEDTAGGSDGWTPPELKALPFEAWASRAEVLKLAGELGTFSECIQNSQYGGHWQGRQ